MPFQTSFSHVLAQSCDCHVHIFDPKRFPYAQDRAYTPSNASVSALQAMHKGMGIARVVLVQPSIYGIDNSCLLDAIAQLGQSNARGIAVVDLTSVSDEELQILHAGGVRGIRLNLHVSGENLSTVEKQVKAAQRIAHLPGWHLQVHARMEVHVAMLEHYKTLGIPVVLDHFAGGVSPSSAAEGHLSQLLNAMQNLPLYVKLSAPYRLPSGMPAEELARKFYSAGPDKVLWGSDWPHTGGSGGQGRNPLEIEPFRDINNAESLHQVISALNSADASRKLLADNPSQLYGF